MEKRNLSANITVCDYNELNLTEKNLVDAAKAASLKAYAPYSKFQVGAAALLSDGQIVAGNNQENAAYPSGLCAERTTLFYANATFPETSVTTMAIAAFTNGDFTDDPVTPCGSCRQVLLETQFRYGQPIRLILYGKKAVFIVEKSADLLPLAFNPDALKPL
ncbi:MAG: cytidine deaminase [Dysgonamonadaceae bacterium]|jgi:cytidine deaminase|nr:cytidine deaminase [Dysgonamonadaceae bacterium]